MAAGFCKDVKVWEIRGLASVPHLVHQPTAWANHVISGTGFRMFENHYARARRRTTRLLLVHVTKSPKKVSSKYGT